MMDWEQARVETVRFMRGMLGSGYISEYYEAFADELIETLKLVETLDVQPKPVLKHQREEAERQRNAAVNTVPDKQHDVERCPATWNPGVWPYTTRCAWKAGHEGLRHVDRNGNTYTETVGQHRFSFEGSTSQLATHLVRDHGLTIDNVREWSGGLTQGDWTALDVLHRDAHRKS